MTCTITLRGFKFILSEDKLIVGELDVCPQLEKLIVSENKRQLCLTLVKLNPYAKELLSTYITINWKKYRGGEYTNDPSGRTISLIISKDEPSEIYIDDEVLQFAGIPCRFYAFSDVMAVARAVAVGYVSPGFSWGSETYKETKTVHKIHQLLEENAEINRLVELLQA